MESLQKLATAERLLAEVKTLDDCKGIVDLAEAARIYAKKAKLGLQAQNHAAWIKLSAERKAGEILQGMPKNVGSQGQYPPSHDVTAGRLADIGISRSQSSRWQKVAKLPEPDMQILYSECNDNERELTQAEVLRRVKIHEYGGYFTSNEDDWLTPQEIIDAVIEFWGSIDVDPCSNSKDQPRIPAMTHYTVEDNGLSHFWHGKVYCNPPYGLELHNWITKGLEHFRKGDTQGIIYLLPARTDTGWFQKLAVDATCCFCAGRLRFSETKIRCPFASILAYLGDEWEGFAQISKSLGSVMAQTY